ncbi:kinase-like protein [Gigaspora margarita]|uniref:Kinase-like protein n=1 Tax=Gigaspora margarita TaxID=4874 RepID=A0A8H4A4I9_GIGMA|nr:kinase-like protein [Gigaspora margarita]
MKLQWTDKLRIAKEIVDGLSFLHDNDIIHRDLHPLNILIHENRPKIADFDQSRLINDMPMASDSQVYGMVAYLDPHCLKNPDYKRDKKSDVYSLGVILWEISSGKPPFQSSIDKVNMLLLLIIQGKREIPIKGTPPQYVKLYSQCWDEDPANRPETKLVLNTLILENMREEARECFRQGKFLKTLELFEQILGHSQHSLEDQKSASTWVLSYSRCESEKINELTKALCKNTTLTSLDLKSNELGSGEVKKEEKH